jgi:hypothetical protein
MTVKEKQSKISKNFHIHVPILKGYGPPQDGIVKRKVHVLSSFNSLKPFAHGT